jgi:hypothetical protein
MGPAHHRPFLLAQESNMTPIAVAVETAINAAAPARIRALNDALRMTGCGGKTVMTRGVSALATDALVAVLKAISRFDGFTAENDPYGEHDCAVVEAAGHRVIWKIDYYDPAMQAHSDDPADLACTCRVMTIMLAEEY